MLNIYLKADFDSIDTNKFKKKKKVLQKSVITASQSHPSNVLLNLGKINLIYLAKLHWSLLPSN